MRCFSRLVFIITCLLSTVDTHLFVYPSLSRHLLLEIGIAVMAIVLLCVVIAKRHRMVISRFEIFLIAWIAYIIMHGLFMPSFEQYRSIYLCMTLLLVIFLANMQRSCLLAQRDIVSALLFVAGLHLIYIIGQEAGIIESGNIYFRVTGCNENPTVTALYLTGCLPMMFTRIVVSKARAVYIVLLAFCVCGIILLRCRTAYIGMCIELPFVIGMFIRNKLRNLFTRSFLFGAVAIVALMSVAVASVGLYYMKRDSADGRKLIWRLSSEMIAENPLGYGYGLFEKNYNLKQAGYFAGGNFTATEERNANFVYMPYNDYLEHGVEGGIAGMLFLILFYAIMIKQALLTGKRDSAAVFCSFAVMSLFNFIYTSILPWILLMCYASFTINEEGSNVIRRQIPHYIQVGLLALISILTLRICKMTEAQITLKRLSSQPAIVSDGEYARIEASIGTSEAYWTKRAANSIKANRFEDALVCIRKARTYSSVPTIFMAEHYCLWRMNRIEESIKCRDTLSLMAPKRLGLNHTNK